MGNGIWEAYQDKGGRLKENPPYLVINIDREGGLIINDEKRPDLQHGR